MSGKAVGGGVLDVVSEGSEVVSASEKGTVELERESG